MQKLRNVAIIAHVDHGKTTLVDKLLLLGKLFGDHETPGDLIMDSNDLERERGITITSKNVSIQYKGYKINIIDTPGHADFGGEVERVLNMADGVLLLVDAFEGTMPQTRFVLQKAIELGLKPIVVVNKVDKPNCRPEEVQEQVFDLMFSLEANENQLDFPTVFGSAKEEWMSADWTVRTNDITILPDTIIEHIPAPDELKGTPQMLVTSLEYSPFKGRIAVGRIHRGEFKPGMPVSLMKRDGSVKRTRIKELMVFEGFEKKAVPSATSGDIIALTGIDGFEIGDTVADFDQPEALKTISIDEPTMSMLFTINNSPFFGKDGKYVTSRHIHDRLQKELEKNLALRVEPTGSVDAWNVFGRGVLHLSVLIETMRREGYELQVGQPQVIIKDVGGIRSEPVEELSIDLPDEYSGRAIEMVSQRKGEMKNMERKGERIHLEFTIPSRGIIGMRTQMLTATAGEAVMSHRFIGFEPYKGIIEKRRNGSLISLETGKAITYSLDKLQDRGKFFVVPGVEIYEGQVIGENNRADDITVNISKTKKLTNMRKSGTDENAKLAPPILFTLEEALEYIKGDEYVEVTPNHIRMRKTRLKEFERKRLTNNS